jgi:hypothetical protein
MTECILLVKLEVVLSAEHAEYTKYGFMTEPD